MTDGISAFYDDWEQYKRLCKMFKVKERIKSNQYGISVFDSDHFYELEGKLRNKKKRKKDREITWKKNDFSVEDSGEYHERY
jgi:hypothetical protein